MMQGGIRLFDSKKDASEMEISEEVKPLLRAWILLHSSYSSGGFLAKKRQIKDLQEFMKVFRLQEHVCADSTAALAEESNEATSLWQSFFETLITMNSEDKSYASTIFGMVAMNNSNLYTKIASEILLLTKHFPESVLKQSDADLFIPLCECGKEVFCGCIKNGEQYWEQAMQQ